MARLECYRKWELDEEGKASALAEGNLLPVPDSIRNMTVGTYFHSLAGYYHIIGGVPPEDATWEGDPNIHPSRTPKEWLAEARRCFDFYSAHFNPFGLGDPIHNELILEEKSGIITGVPLRPFTGAIDLVTAVSEARLEEVASNILGPSAQLMIDLGPGIYLYDWKWHQKRSGLEQATSLASHQASAYSTAFSFLHGVKPAGFIFLHIYGHKVVSVEPVVLAPPDEEQVKAFQYLYQREAALDKVGILNTPNPTACVGKYGKLCSHLGTRCKRF